MCSLFNVAIDASLLVEPIILCLPAFARVSEANVEVPNDLGDQFIDLGHGNLRTARQHTYTS